MSQPLISIITATYNRSNILGFTISSVLASLYENWELLVVGDACTDDTESVVNSFGDPRMRFINLPQNVGEQSGPNNEGLRQAQGRYIAFLNHDDLWFPDHLPRMVVSLEKNEADLVFAMGAALQRDGLYRILGAPGRSGYWPRMGVPASLWLFRREMIESVGLWQYYRECYGVPSQDWLYRAWKMQARIVPTNWLTVLLVQSGSRKNVYANRDFGENAQLYQQLATDAGLRERILMEIACTQTANEVDFSWGSVLYRVIKEIYFRTGMALGLSPLFLSDLIRMRRKGSNIDRLRKMRGLAPIGRNSEL